MLPIGFTKGIGRVIYFIHPTYGDMKVPVYYYVCHDYHGAKSLKFPLLVREKDPKGLGCCISISGDGTRMNIIGNEWESFWKTRRGKRAAKRDRFLSYVYCPDSKRKEP